MTDSGDATQRLLAHHRTWSLRGKFIADFAALERDIDHAVMAALDIVSTNEAFLTVVMGRLTARPKIDMLADALDIRGLANEFGDDLKELRSLAKERNRIAHAHVYADVGDAIDILIREGREALAEAIKAAPDTTANYRRTGVQVRPFDSDQEVSDLRDRVKVARLNVIGISARCWQLSEFVRHASTIDSSDREP